MLWSLSGCCTPPRLETVAGYAHLRPTLRLYLELWAAMQASRDATLGEPLVSWPLSERHLAAVPPEALQQITTQFVGAASPGTAAQIAFTLGIDVRDAPGAVPTPHLSWNPPRTGLSLPSATTVVCHPI